MYLAISFGPLLVLCTSVVLKHACTWLPATVLLLAAAVLPRLLLVVGEFRKTRHPRNAKFGEVLEICFSGTGNSRFLGVWNLRRFGFANMRSLGIVIRRRYGVASERKPGISSRRWREPRRAIDSGIFRGSSSEVKHGDIHEPAKKQKPIQESVGDPVRKSCIKIFTNQRRSKVKVVVPKSPGFECELVAVL
jgi:hypothetical protein